MQYCECTNDFVNAIIDDYFNSFEIRKYYINKYEQPYYAVRISKLVEDDTGKVKRKYTYLAYFAKPEMAYTYLAEYNSGAVVPEHMKYSDSPTFAEMYEKWKKYRKSLKNQISDSTWRNYEIAFHHFSELHDRKFISIRTNDLQQCLNAYNHKSQTTISSMRAVLKAMYQYAKLNEYIDRDLTEGLVYEWTNSMEQIHDGYSDEESLHLRNLHEWQF